MEAQSAKAYLNNVADILEGHCREFDSGFPAPASVNGLYHKIENNDWTAGFYTGMMWMLYEHTGRSVFREVAEKHLYSFEERLERRVVIDHHDMGFIFGPSCVAAYMLTGSVQGRKTALLAADNLKSRFHTKGEFLQAWGALEKPAEYRLIIDCLLNLPLLYWASETTGDGSYRVLAEKHLATARKTLIRADYSTYHTYYFDRETGKPTHGATKQGYSNRSTWARGQAWAVYGLIMNYAHTKDETILPQWRGVTNYFYSHLPPDLAAYWDLTFTSGAEPRDSSASAIAVCGMLEAHRLGVCDGEYRSKAYEILKSLAANYAAVPQEDGNGILKHSTYGRLLGEGIDEYTLWGDYFYTEALMRVAYPGWNARWWL